MKHQAETRGSGRGAQRLLLVAIAVALGLSAPRAASAAPITVE